MSWWQVAEFSRKVWCVKELERYLDFLIGMESHHGFMSLFEGVPGSTGKFREQNSPSTKFQY
jgi:hypothetical protein